MVKPSLPSRPDETWEGGFFFDAAREVRGVCARGGLVFAGGADLFLLRPGAAVMASRPPPLDIGPVHAVAVEPRGARRYAVASEALIAVFFKNKQGEQILRLRPQPPGPRATHLAWGASPEGLTLYIRRDDGVVLRFKPDLSDIDELGVPSMDAIASDEAGVLAMASLAEELAFVTRDGADMSYRPLDVPVESAEEVHLAVADEAIAVGIEGAGAFLSRSKDAAFEACAALGEGGAVAFQGTASDAALFGAIREPRLGAVVRVDRSGAAVRIAEFGGDGGAAVPEVTSLSWDATRTTLWAASPQVGLITSEEPSAKGRKKIVLS